MSERFHGWGIGDFNQSKEPHASVSKGKVEVEETRILDPTQEAYNKRRDECSEAKRTSYKDKVDGNTNINKTSKKIMTRCHVTNIDLFQI